MWSHQNTDTVFYKMQVEEKIQLKIKSEETPTLRGLRKAKKSIKVTENGWSVRVDVLIL